MTSNGEHDDSVVRIFTCFVESQRKTCAAKSLLHPCKTEDLTEAAEAFVLDLMSQL